MATNIDSLQIQITANATKANSAIDKLVGKLDRLSNSLGSINTTNLNTLTNSVDRFGKTMQTVNAIKATGISRVANGLTKLGSVNFASINGVVSAMPSLVNSLNSLGAVSQNAIELGQFANNISKLGSKSTQTAIANMPVLAAALNNLMFSLSKTPAVSQNVIQMTNALANLSAQGRKVGTASNQIQKGLNKASTSAKKAKSSFGGLASAIGKFYATYFLVVRGLKGLWNAIGSTADYIEAFNYFNVALGKIGNDWAQQWNQYSEEIGVSSAEEYADSFKTRLSQSLGALSGVKIEIDADGQGLLTETGMKNLGLNIQEVTQYASQLASVTNSVGQTGEVSLAAAEAFSKLGADISSLFNIDYSQAMTNLQSGLIGQSRALYKYGIDITNATLQTYAYELGIEKAVSEMTQAEKMQLRMLAILDQSKVSWGDLANTIESPSNMIRQFKNNLKETGMVLGQLFVPVLQKVLPILNGVTIALKRMFTNIASAMGVTIDLESFGQGYTSLEDDVDGLTDSLDDATTATKKLKNATLGIDELNVISANESDVEIADTSNLEDSLDLTEEIIKATEEYKKVWDKAYAKMEAGAQKFADKIYKYFSAIPSITGLLFGDGEADWEGAGKAMSAYAHDLIESLGYAIEDLKTSDKWKEIGQNIVDFICGVDWGQLTWDLSKFIFALGEALIDIPYSFWTGVTQRIVDKIFGEGTFTVKESDKEKAFLKLFSPTTGLISKISALWDICFADIFGKDVFETKLSDITTVWDETLDSIKLKWSTWSEALRSDNILPFFSKSNWTFSGIKDGLVTAFNNAIDAIKGVWNGFADWFNDAMMIDFGGVSKDLGMLGTFEIPAFEISLGSLPTFETGGFPEDGLFMANHSELVGQFSNGRTAVANNGQIVEGIEGGVERAVARVLAPYLADIAQNTRETAEKDFSVNIGDRDIARANARGVKSMGVSLVM